MPRPVLLVLPVLFAATASAQTTPPVQQVEIKGPSGDDQRRHDGAGRIAIGRDEIVRYGDVNVSALLKRQPGIAVVNGEVRMRGLGAGYTQILIDGQAAPPGFSIDTLATSMIERIDILRNGSAEFGSQAIAGSINIIMRKNHTKAQRELTAGASAARGHLVMPSAALRWADQRDDLAWSLGAELSRPEYRYDESGYETELNTDGRVVNDRIIRSRGVWATGKVSLSPRINWKLGGGDSLAWQATADRSRTDTQGCSAETVLQGASTTYPDNCFPMDMTTKGLRSDLTWTRTIGPGKLVAKGAVNRNTRTSDYRFTGVGNGVTFARRVLSDALDNTTSISGKYLAPLGSAHSLGLGWDAGRTLRTEFRNQLDRTTGKLPEVLDEDYDATVNRLAFFAQDEWAVTPRLQVYVGARWEGLRTDVAGRTMDRVRNRSSVVSPVAQLVWKLPDSEQDQIRVALSRTYKAPLTRLLVPRRYTTNNGNSPTNPDVRGNPQLRPELAWGLDAGYEKYFGKAGMVSVSAYMKRIDDVIVYALDPDLRPWLSAPSNKGSAKVAGLEADGKYAPHPALDLRANLGYNWSRLDAIPGPDNRLVEQVRVSANAGFDYRLAPTFTTGANLNVQFAGAMRVSAVQTSYTGPLRNLDLYGVWKISAGATLRLAVTEALGQDRESRQAYLSEDGLYSRRFVETNRRVIRLTLEAKI